MFESFCHDVKKHGIVFGAAANIVNVKIKLGGSWECRNQLNLRLREMNYVVVDCCVVVVYGWFARWDEWHR